jgi:hypothetical protein
MWLNLMCPEKLAGMMSYPNYGGLKKALQFPDVRTARAARATTTSARR